MPSTTHFNSIIWHLSKTEHCLETLFFKHREFIGSWKVMLNGLSDARGNGKSLQVSKTTKTSHFWNNIHLFIHNKTIDLHQMQYYALKQTRDTIVRSLLKTACSRLQNEHYIATELFSVPRYLKYAVRECYDSLRCMKQVRVYRHEGSLCLVQWTAQTHTYKLNVRHIC